ncbi:methyltransferase type 12 [Rhizobium leguminosarum bv. trifolii]|uniref:class I SAM-dependent DNA methyltransferase n=1 Tax=Rhizobium leguminosarum TaxID=384 RepID=UPI000E2EF79D|nr:methyltransferase domain-containing protein [Rhizobium leguminosarum]RFB88385.1 methyltransferase type 12 [Rhizobium leguminosarum bv. trifolii]
MHVSSAALADTQRTIDSYEGCADEYSRIVDPFPAASLEAALRQVAIAAGQGGRVLEIGSGPGWDADFLETQGVFVRRTDATRRFLELQAAGGKAGEFLNVITDDLGGPYDAVIALCVLIHVPRDQTGHVLEKIAAALRPGGVFLVTMRDGDGETSGAYHMTYWRRDDFALCIKAAGLDLEWDAYRMGRNNEAWNTFYARRPG